jgi:hypothetical protein
MPFLQGMRRVAEVVVLIDLLAAGKDAILVTATFPR